MICHNCSTRPLLKFTTPSIFGLAPPLTCKQCGVLIVSKSGHFKCEKCQFALCPNCKICSFNHIMARTTNPLGPNTLKLHFHCNACKKEKKFDAELGVFFCRKCVFGICDDCLNGPRTEYPLGFLTQAKMAQSPIKQLRVSKETSGSPKHEKKESKSPTGLPKKMGQAASKVKPQDQNIEKSSSFDFDDIPEFAV